MRPKRAARSICCPGGFGGFKMRISPRQACQNCVQSGRDLESLKNPDPSSGFFELKSSLQSVALSKAFSALGSSKKWCNFGGNRKSGPITQKNHPKTKIPMGKGLQKWCTSGNSFFYKNPGLLSGFFEPTSSHQDGI